MNKDRTKPYRYGAVGRQVRRVADDHQRHVRRAWVERVLDLLDGDNLIGQAASRGMKEDGMLFDCNVAPLVWDDPRVAFRRQQLEGSDLRVELVDHEHQVAGRTFSRAQIRVTYAA